MADKGSRLVVTRILAVLLAAVLAMELVPAAALAETIAMREEPVATGATGDTEEMAAEEGAGREAPAPVAADQPSQGVGEVPVAPQADSAPVADPAPVDGAVDAGLDTQSVSVSAPRVRADSSMESGQVATWDCVWLGSYPQTEVPETDALMNASWTDGDATVGGVRYRRISRDDATSSGNWSVDGYGSVTYRYFRYEPIKWRVLKVDGDTALAVADVALDCRRYHKTRASVTWETSTVRSWLNGTGTAPYYDSGAQSGRAAQAFATVAFTPGQLGAVRQSAIENADNTYYGTDGGVDTTDRVFLLSESEVHGASATAHGFVSSYSTYDEARRCRPTDFARAMGAWVSTSGSYAGNCFWWLRSPGYDARCAADVGYFGYVHRDGNFDVNDDGYVVRPALNLNLSSPHVQPAGTVSSDGTVDEVAPTSTDPSGTVISSTSLTLGSDSGGSVTDASALKFFPGNYSLGLTYIPVTFSKETDSAAGTVTYRLAVGVGRKDLLDSKSTWNQFKSNVEAVDKQQMRFDTASAFAQGKSFGIVTSEGFKAKPKLGLMGYGEFTYRGNDLVSQASRIVTEASWAAHVDWQFWTPIGPLYLQLKGGAKVTGAGKASFQMPSGETTYSGMLTLTPNIALEGGYGIASVATVGVQGSAAVPIQVAPLPTKGEFEAKASLHLYLVFVIDWSHDLAQFKWQLWPKWGPATQSLAAQASGTGTFKEADRGYSERTSAWAGDAAAEGGLSAQGEGLDGFATLQESVMPQAIPLMAEAGGTRVMVFQQDDPEREALDSSRLAYSVLGEGGWSEPRPVWDTGTLDAYADLRAVGDDLWVVWQKERRKVEGDVSSDADGVMRSLASGFEVCAARFDPRTGTFVDAAYVTDNSCLDMMPALAEGASSPQVAFVRDTSGGLDQSSGTREVVLATLDGGSWREERLAEEGGRVSGVAAAVVGGQTEVAYTTVGDGEGGARGAGTVRLARSGVEIAGGEEQPTGLQWEQGRLWWTSDGLVRAHDPATGGTSTLNPELLANPEQGSDAATTTPAAVGDAMQVLSGDRGTTVLWTQTDGEECTSSVCSAVVGEGDVLSGRVDLRTDGFGIAASSALAEAGGGYSIVANTFDANDVHNLAYTTIGPAGGFEAQGAGAYAEDGSATRVTYGFVNNSEEAVRGYVVTVRRGGEVVAQRTFDVTVAPGAREAGELPVEGVGVTDDDVLTVEVAPVSGAQAAAICDVEVTTTAELDALAKGPAQVTSVEVADGGYVFDGAAKRPAVKVRSGNDVVPAGGYTVSYRNNVNAGTATVEVEGAGNYGGSARATFTIAPAGITSVTVPGGSCTYDGKAKRPSVTVRAGGLVVPGTGYDVAYKNNVNPGTATVTVTGKGNYAGSASTTFAIRPAPKTFPDVPANAWYAGVVSRAVGLGLMSGYKDGRFGPADKVTRGQVAVILWNMAGQPAAGSGARTFPDVASNQYFYDAVRWASSKGVVSGYGNGKFGPNDDVTREQLAAMLANYARSVAGRQVSGSAADYAKMRDGAKVSSWAQASVGWCFKSGIISGTKDGNVNPKGNATRAEAAKMVVVLHDMLG